MFGHADLRQITKRNSTESINMQPTRHPILKKTILFQALAFAFGNYALMNVVHAQENNVVQKVEITGSTIKRAAIEGALPVQVITHEMIERSGATSVAELVQNLPVMQDFLSQADTINGSGNGIQNANIHGIGRSYTLTLLNGKRMAPYGSGSNSSDLNSIPINAIERVEILTDGASAIYGSDAVGGVINFIMKKNYNFKTVDVSYSTPQGGSHGAVKTLGFTAGFGNKGEDSYNIMVGASRVQQIPLDAKDRAFATTGIHPFTQGGKNYTTIELSDSTSPANISIVTRDKPSKTIKFNPNLLNTGACPVEGTIIVGNICKFDYAHVIQIIGASTQDNVFTNGRYDITPNHSFYGTINYTHFVSTPSYAPPAGSRTIRAGTELFNKFITPYLAKIGVAASNVKSASYNYRLTDAGRRTNVYDTKSSFFSTGFDGKVLDWDYDLNYSYSQSYRFNSYTGGYLYGTKFDALVASGAYNPLIAPTADTKQTLEPAIIHEKFYDNINANRIFSARANRALWNLAGGASYLSLGADHTTRYNKYDPSALAQGANRQQPDYSESVLGGSQGLLPAKARRSSYGLFSELLLPVLKNLEVSASARYDHYSKVDASIVYDLDGNIIPAKTIGAQYGGITYKISTAFRPTSKILLRAAFGSAFSAPQLSDITAPNSYDGFTSTAYPCPIISGPLLQYCTGTDYYGTVSGGNPYSGAHALKAERSKQTSAGFRIELTDELSIGFDWYRIKIRDQILGIGSKELFGHPEKYQDLFGSYFDKDEGRMVITAASTKVNRYNSLVQGIDWDHSYKTKTSLGKFDINWSGNYAISNQYQYPEADPVAQIANADNSGASLFRWNTIVSATWYSSDRLSHNFSMNAKSGYHDYTYKPSDKLVVEMNPDGSYSDRYAGRARDVKSFKTFNWQTRAELNDKLSLTFGIRNLFNTDPPYSQVTTGSTIGYFGAVSDPLGRTYSLKLKYNF